MDAIWILAVMTFPNDQEMREAYYAVKFAESELEEEADAETLEIGIDLLDRLIAAPGKSEFERLVAKQSRDAFIAGNYLLSLFVMSSFPNNFDEPSARKAIFLAQKLAEDSRYGDGSKIPHSETKIRRCFDEFRRVAHFWAALALHEGFPIREQLEVLASEEAVRDFLGIAGTLQDFGCWFSADRPKERDRKTVLDREEVWGVPASVNRLMPPWNAPPPWIIEKLKEYKAAT